MASSINASTSAGVITTADTSGVLNIQTAGTTAISIDASQAVSFTNSPTVTGGTANGVAYLNGSKVLTTGSALVFDGSNLGLGVTPSTWGSGYRSLDIGNSASFLNSSGSAFVSNNAYQDSGWKYKTSTANIGTQLFGLNPNGSGGYAWFQAASGTAGNAITFTQAMTLDASGNLGIGTTSPSSFVGSGNKLVVGNASTTTTSAGISVYSGTATYGGLYFADGTIGDQAYRGAVEYNHSTDALLMYSAGAERARIDSSGNLGVGVTPSAWNNIFKAVQINAQGCLMATSATMQMGNNIFYDGAYKFIGTGYANRYYQATGQHVWTVSTASGSAGGAITETQAMTLDASGNLLVGNTSTQFCTLFTGAGSVIRNPTTTTNTKILEVAGGTDVTVPTFAVFYNANNTAMNAANSTVKIGQMASTARSINATGSINASGADYAEYMTKAGNFNVAKGDVVGINAEGKLTNVFDDAVSFVVKSTSPSYVGGDTWGIGFDNDAEGLEAARQTVDRIAFAGQVPVNVIGATSGQYIIPVNDNGAIKGQAINEADMTLTQYMKAVGKVIAIESDGRAKIIVKVA